MTLEPGSYPRPWAEGDPKPGRDPSLIPDVWVYLGKKRWPYFADETTSPQARKVREVTGRSRGYWIGDVAATGGGEVDSWAVICWLARMQNGEPDLTLAEVEAGLVFGADFGILPGTSATEADLEAEAERPEA